MPNLIKLKSFIYRFSNIFGLRIYLAQKEERAYLNSLELSGEDYLGLHSGLWQARHNFTTIYTKRMKPLQALKNKIIHAFTF